MLARRPYRDAARDKNPPQSRPARRDRGGRGTRMPAARAGP